MTPPALPDLPSRGRTYAFLAGAVATLLAVSVAIPLVLGDRPDTGAGQGGSLAVAPPAAAPRSPVPPPTRASRPAR
ncbi:MAG: hypothetical protein LC789_09555 [Actinobacteria bacterium]|nr:hypothetical protein [Actinomycetota bacterium]